jgi:hypothetical protein
VEFPSKCNHPILGGPRPMEKLPWSVDQELRYIRSTAIACRDIAGELMVVPICKGVGDLDSIYTFNSLGRSLWLLLETACTTEELASWVAAHCEVSMERAVADVRAFLSDLQELGLIHGV